MYYDALYSKLQSADMCIGIIGLGYVGLPLALEMVRAGYRVIGIDLSHEKVAMLKRGQSYVVDVPDRDLRAAIDSGMFQATTDYSTVSEMDAISICVPTPLRKTKDPDTSHITDAINRITHYLRHGRLIVLESTTYPGTTEELVGRTLTNAGLTIGEDVFLCFSLKGWILATSRSIRGIPLK